MGSSLNGVWIIKLSSVPWSVLSLGLDKFNCRFFLNSFPIHFNLFVLLFLVTSCLVVAVQPLDEWMKFQLKWNFTKKTKKNHLCILEMSALTLFRMGLFGATHGMERGKKPTAHPLPKICHTYPIMMKLGTVIHYLKKI